MSIHHYSKTELAKVIADMREHIHQELTRQIASTPMSVEIRFSKLLLQRISPPDVAREVEGLERFLANLPQVKYRLKQHPRATRHELEITVAYQQEENEMRNQNRLSDWVKKLAQMVYEPNPTSESDKDTEKEEKEHIPQKASNPSGQSKTEPASKPQKAAPGVNINNPYPKVMKACAKVVTDIVDCANKVNEFVDGQQGRKRLIVDRVSFRPLTAEAEQEYRDCFNFRDNTATWRGMLKQFVKMEHKDVLPFLNLDQPRFVLLPIDNSADEVEDELQDFNTTTQSEGFEVKIIMREEDYQEPETVDPAGRGVITLEIRDRQNPSEPRKERMDKNSFTVGLDGDIKLDSEFCSGKHLLFERDEQRGWSVTDCSTNGSVMNNQLMPPGVAVEIKAGSVFRLATQSANNPSGNFADCPELRVTQVFGRTATPIRVKPVVPASATPTPVSPKKGRQSEIATPITKVVKARVSLYTAGAWKTLPLTTLPSILGRHEDCDIVVDGNLHHLVSRKHLQIEAINANDITIQVCPDCVNDVYVNERVLPTGMEHQIPFEQELCLADESQPGHLKIRFLKGQG